MLSALEIERFFTLEAAELAETRRRRGPMNRLAVAPQIWFHQDDRNAAEFRSAHPGRSAEPRLVPAR